MQRGHTGFLLSASKRGRHTPRKKQLEIPRRSSPPRKTHRQWKTIRNHKPSTTTAPRLETLTGLCSTACGCRRVHPLSALFAAIAAASGSLFFFWFVCSGGPHRRSSNLALAQGCMVCRTTPEALLYRALGRRGCQVGEQMGVA